MTPIPFYIVDVFTQQKYTGNQLAVFRTGALSDAEMQAIALETHFSETTFILSDEARDGGYDVRIFTPEQELPFAGHPTLGTAYIIQQHLIGQPVERVTLNLAVGQIPVTFSYRDGQPDMLWMQQKAPQFGATVAAERLAVGLRLDVSDIDDRFPIQVVSTGIAFLMVPLRSRAAVVKATVVKEVLGEILKQTKTEGALIFCPEPYSPDNTLNARALFAGLLDSAEDPATGSANGCLAGYLSHHQYFGGSTVDIRVEQGYEIKRPSLLHLKASPQNGAIDVRVGGSVVSVAQGSWGD
ncbi:MAG: PhzF family phenazine biosynthesis protein [Anaerolineae bacterium]|nr:PhzF family phenazine biosynthesis protein [Anaerolineae bacterium]